MVVSDWSSFSNMQGGKGGDSLFGYGGIPGSFAIEGPVAAVQGTGYGSGAAGGFVISTTGITGEVGQPGVVRITEFIAV